MNYRVNKKNGDKLSILAFGCMRFPRSEKEAAKQVINAIDNGVNYFDTAYIYPGNEAVLGRILKNAPGYRDKINIATKIPPYFINKYEDFDRILNIQLKRLQTDRIDYYLIHMLTSLSEWTRLLDLGVLKWIAAIKSSGKIKNIGFSYHGGKEEFKKIIDAYPWEFCMLQYNYFDENNQAGREGVNYAAKKDIPVMVMEPLRGGKLAGNLPKEALNVWHATGFERSPAEWALRWIWNQPEILTVLSGMNSQAMLDENIRIASQAEANSLSETELETYKTVGSILRGKTSVACTGCNYCMPCPRGVDIPMCFNAYNDIKMEGKLIAKAYYAIRTNNHQASLCTRCGKCETHCPQNIAIRDELTAAAKALESFPYGLLRPIVRRFLKLSKGHINTI